MQHLTKKRLLSSFVVASLILYVLLFSITPNTITNVSGVETEGMLLGVYWNSECTNRTAYIDWKTLTPGSAKKYDVYVRNEDLAPIYYLRMKTENWSSSNAFRYLKLTWNYARQRIDPYDVLPLTLTLYVDPSIKGVSEFSFDILIDGRPNSPGDINGNGVIDGLDYALFGAAWNSHGPDIPDPGDPRSENWDPNCDFNNNDMIESMDFATFIIYWGEYA